MEEVLSQGVVDLFHSCREHQILPRPLTLSSVTMERRWSAHAESRLNGIQREGQEVINGTCLLFGAMLLSSVLS